MLDIMLKLYLDEENHSTQWIEEKLENLVVAYELVDANKYELPEGIEPKELPVLSDGHENWVTEEEIKGFLHELDQELTFSRSLTSDACYIDPDNPDQCL